MNDGGRDGGRDEESSAKKGGDFGRALSRIAVAQICDSTGFQGCQRSAIGALTDVAIRYICGLGKAANFYANTSGRSECNIFDIIQGLEDLGVAQGFTGASDVDHCLVGSGAIQEITRYVNTAAEVPFPCAVPHFPVERPRKPIPSFAQLGETPAGSHIPDWLPAFPDPRTYVRTPVPSKRESSLRADRIEQAKQQRKAESSLLNLQRRLTLSGGNRLVPADDVDAERGKQAVQSNPFLAQPLPYGEKEVSDVVAANEDDNKGKKVSILDTFAPAIEVAKIGSLDVEDGDKRPFPNKRPRICVKFGVKKKHIFTSMSSQAPSVDLDSFISRDDAKDEKKRRAEMILREAMENPQDLMQL